MKLRELIPLRYMYLNTLRWSHTMIYLSELGILLFFLLQGLWVPLALFLIFFVAEEYAYNKKVTKIEVAARIN